MRRSSRRINNNKTLYRLITLAGISIWHQQRGIAYGASVKHQRAAAAAYQWHNAAAAINHGAHGIGAPYQRRQRQRMRIINVHMRAQARMLRSSTACAWRAARA